MGPPSPSAQPHPPKRRSSWSSCDSDLETTSLLGRKEPTPKKLGATGKSVLSLEQGKEEEAAASYLQTKAHLTILELDLKFISYHPKPSASPHCQETQPGPQWKARPLGICSNVLAGSDPHLHPQGHDSKYSALSSPNTCPLIGPGLPWRRSPELVTLWPHRPACPTI